MGKSLAVLMLIGLAFSQQKVDLNTDWKPMYDGSPIRTNSKSAWDYQTETNISGKITEYASSGSFIVRCSRSCEVFFTPERYETVDYDSHSVLVKFDDKPVKRYGVSRSEDGASYFFSDPIAILKAIRDNGGYMTIEYKPYGRIAKTVKYGVWYLPPSILGRLEAHAVRSSKK